MLRNIIFDWSGTLVDDLPAVWHATNHVLMQSGMPELTLEKFRAEFCLPFSTFYERFPNLDIARLEVWFHARFKEVQDTVVELPRAREFLEFCRMRNVRCFVLSAVHADHFAVQTAVNGFGEYFERAYTGVWNKQEKIHEILRQHELEPVETLFIGDMQHDIETAHHGGIHSCAVLTGYNTVAQLKAAQPDVIVEHLGELKQLLEKNEMPLGPQTPIGTWTQS